MNAFEESEKRQADKDFLPFFWKLKAKLNKAGTVTDRSVIMGCFRRVVRDSGLSKKMRVFFGKELLKPENAKVFFAEKKGTFILKSEKADLEADVKRLEGKVPEKKEALKKKGELKKVVKKTKTVPLKSERAWSVWKVLRFLMFIVPPIFLLWTLALYLQKKK